MRETIRSPDNPLVKELRHLHRADERARQNAFLVEGRRAIDGFLEAGWRATVLLHPENEPPPPGWPADVARAASARVAARISQATTASGWIAVFALPAEVAPDPAAGGLILAEIADPGNAGTLIRSAAAFGCPQVHCLGGCDPWSHKVVQASAGALARVRLSRSDPALGLAGLRSGAPLTALVVNGGLAPQQLAPGPRWLLVGSEAHGLRPEWQAACTQLVTLPMPGGVESLNAAVAGSIAGYLIWAVR
ncbi:MAG: RNA methyltransferase [Planctomycetes bacterium]|nr:RNA methyltransferase [Planctomycetota bacterium]